jgi:37-kD nucleoid-associated bacterial protein
MTGLKTATIQQAIVHKVGNPTRGEELKLSGNGLSLNDDVVRQLLTQYFLTPFNENEHYHFTHLSNIALNEVYNYVQEIFSNPKNFIAQSAVLAQFLYTKSTHAKVKEGELYVVHFNDVLFNSDSVEAIGIFKSENKETFLKVFPHGQSWEVIAEDGININKLDKGCLVIKQNAADGYIVLAVDNTNKQNDAQYWMNDFLQIERLANNYHHTNDMMSMCKLFIDNEMAEKFDVNKTEQIDMLNRSMEYFKTNEQFAFDDFTKEVIHHDEVIDAFTQYKQTFENARQVHLDDEFDIHLSAVKKQERNFKSILKLDKNFHVYIHGRRDLIERGVDELSGKNFYKLYFDNES